MPNGLRLPALPGTEAEVKTVSAFLPPAEVIVLDRNNAGISKLIATLPDATVLHFATHAVVNDADPFASFLALNRDQDGGELMTADVYSLRLHTSLVVLSVCRTGLGKISGDGVGGLGRGKSRRQHSARKDQNPGKSTLLDCLLPLRRAIRSILETSAAFANCHRH